MSEARKLTWPEWKKKYQILETDYEKIAYLKMIPILFYPQMDEVYETENLRALEILSWLMTYGHYKIQAEGAVVEEIRKIIAVRFGMTYDSSDGVNLSSTKREKFLEMQLMFWSEHSSHTEFSNQRDRDDFDKYLLAVLRTFWYDVGGLKKLVIKAIIVSDKGYLFGQCYHPIKFITAIPDLYEYSVQVSSDRNEIMAEHQELTLNGEAWQLLVDELDSQEVVRKLLDNNPGDESANDYDEFLEQFYLDLRQDLMRINVLLPAMKTTQNGYQTWQALHKLVRLAIGLRF